MEQLERPTSPFDRGTSNLSLVLCFYAYRAKIKPRQVGGISGRWY